MKFVRNIFNVNHIPNHNHHKKIDISNHKTDNAIKNQVKSIVQLITFDATQIISNFHVSHHVYLLSIYFVTFEEKNLAKTKAKTITKTAKNTFLIISDQKLDSIELDFEESLESAANTVILYINIQANIKIDFNDIFIKRNIFFIKKKI
ncbi:MAG: hypothetical protein Q8S84_00800 [bacterium]|nr:hypothetical protein [bacterium]